MYELDKLSLEGFLEYSQEANTRSTLAVEDGLKPVHRRILYSMAEDKVLSNKSHVKSAKIVGQVLGAYHPHGDSSVYDAAIRLSQDFKLRYPLIDFYGNNGSILDPDSYAASRYTSMRLSPLGELMLQDIKKDTVPMTENYSGDLLEPVVLPSMVPNVLLNGGMGIGVGVSSSLLPHNLSEVVEGIKAYIKNPRITTEQLMNYIQGPDFPTGAIITDGFSLKEAYDSGKGTVKLRAKYSIQNVGGRAHIVITEVPYLISIENRIINKIKEMVTEEDYDKIYDVQNSSGKHGLELRIILEKDVNPMSVIKEVFDKTGLETTVKINQTVMLADGNFVTLGLRGLISYYLKHQHTILMKKYQWELNKARERLNIVNGIIIAIQNIDEVVKIIKQSETTSKAKVALIKRFNLNEPQAKAILDMKLSRLTSLEINGLLKEKEELEKQILDFIDIINKSERREAIIIKFLNDLKAKFGDDRRTTISEMTIVEKGEHVYIAVDNANNFKSVLTEEIATLSRGKKGTLFSKNNSIISAIECNTKDRLLLLDIHGKVYITTGADIVEGNIKVDSQIIQILKPEDKDFMIFVTQEGIIKKTPSIKFKRTVQVTKVRDSDRLIGMYFANDTDYIMALGSEGKAINLKVSDINSIGKLTYGSKGMSTKAIVAATVSGSDDLILTITAENKAKLTKHEDFLVNTKATTGQLITDDCIYILNIGTSTSITLFGEDGRAANINVGSLAIKGRNSMGAKIFNSKIRTVIKL